MPSVVLDTNVLYAGLYSSTGMSFRLLTALSEGRFKVILSTALVFEYEDVLRRRKKELRLSDAAIETILDNLCLNGSLKKVHFLWRPQLRDPKDDHILELAVASNGRPIVTFNKSDFEGAKSFGIRVLSPKQFWEEFL